MPFWPNFNPQYLNAVTVATPGTKVRLVTALLTAVNLQAPGGVVLDAATDLVAANKVYLAALPANVGSVYVGSATLNKTTMAGVIAVIAKSSSFSFTSNVNLNGYRLNEWFIDADNAGDGLGGCCFDQI